MKKVDMTSDISGGNHPQTWITQTVAAFQGLPNPLSAVGTKYAGEILFQ